jgi:toxin ParE1/3/4
MLIRRPEAEQDLIEIYLHISRDNPTAAEKLVRAIDAKCEWLSRMPMMGRARPELRPDLRSFPHGAYLILYRPIDGGAEIVRVVHAARNLDDLVWCARRLPAALAGFDALNPRASRSIQ